MLLPPKIPLFVSELGQNDHNQSPRLRNFTGAGGDFAGPFQMRTCYLLMFPPHNRYYFSL